MLPGAETSSYYEVLGLPASSSEDEIRRAYRRLALKSHPDKEGGDSERFKILSEAYEVLGDAEKRATYDRLGKAGVHGGGTGPSPEELFRQVFGDAMFNGDLAAIFREMSLPRAPRKPPRPPDLSRMPPPMDRAGLAALVASLQRDWSAPGMKPPAEAAEWSAEEVRTFFEHGGNWRPLRPRMDGLEFVGKGARTTPLIRWVHPMAAALPQTSELSMLELVDAGDAAAMKSIVRLLASNGAVAIRLGLDADLWATAQSEAASTVGAMRGAVLPDGRQRGDLFVRLSQCTAHGAAQNSPVLRGLHEALSAIGTELTPHLAADPLNLVLTERSDMFITCVPERAAVAAHYDSACTAPGAPLERKLSLTVYLDDGQQTDSTLDAPATGEELLYDERAACWRSVTPSRDLLLLSLSDRVLHRVAPVAARRISLSTYFLGGYQMPAANNVQAATSQPWTAPPQLQRAEERLAQPMHLPTMAPQPAGRENSSDSEDEEGAMDELG